MNEPMKSSLSKIGVTEMNEPTKSSLSKIGVTEMNEPTKSSPSKYSYNSDEQVAMCIYDVLCCKNLY